MTDIDSILIFTDASTSSKAMLSVGAFLCLHQQQIEEYTKCSLEDLLIKLSSQLIYKIYKSKKSTWSEIKIAVDALDSIIKKSGSIRNVEIYTDCQSLCDLLNKRKEKLERNNFTTKSGSILENAKLYKEFFLLANQFQIKIFKMKGHAPKATRLNVHEKIFTVLDKLSRKKLRFILNNDIP